MRPLASLFSLAFLGSALLIHAGCTSLDGLSGANGGGKAPSSPNDDDGTCTDIDFTSAHDHCGACGNACGAMDHCLESTCAPGCPDHAVYVSADGNDNADGCSTKTPKRTIGAALALLKTLGAQKHEVRVCRGQYTESVTLDYAANLAGGFECSTWKRSEGYGAPTYDPTNASIVSAPPNAPALVVTGVADVTVDGFTFRASEREVSVLGRGAAKVTLSNDVVIGSAGSQDASPASVGVLVDDGAWVTLNASRVDGGSGQKTGSGGYGSAAIYATQTAGALTVSKSTLKGGAGSVPAGTGSTGILAFGGRISVLGSSIQGGTGKTPIGSASFGVILAPGKTDVDVMDNVIDGGSGSCTGDCASTGARVATSGAIRFTGNRVTGGEVDAGANDVGFLGVSLGDFATADVQNNEVYSGNTKRKLTRGVVALEVKNGNTLLLAHNTLGVGPSPLSTGSALVVDAKAATVANNIFFHAGSSVDHAARVSSCNGKKVVAFRNNAWLGFPADKPLIAIDAIAPNGFACNPTASASAVANVEQSIDAAFGAGVALGNIRIAAACNGDTSCRPSPACTTAATCAAAVFGAWDDATAGNLLTGGWKLAAGAPCAVVRATGSVSALSPKDAWGNDRTEPRSLGAHESDAACQ